MRTAVVTLGVCLALTVSPLPLAQAESLPGAGGGSGGKSDTPPITVPLTIGGDLEFNADGSFGPHVPGVHLAGLSDLWGTGSGQQGGSTPPDPPSISVGDLNALRDQAMRWRIANCLTQ